MPGQLLHDGSFGMTGQSRPHQLDALEGPGQRYEIGAGLSPAVDRLVDLPLARLGPEPAKTAP